MELYEADIFIVQARAVSTDGLRPSFFTINAAVYVVQVKYSAPLKMVFLTFFLEASHVPLKAKLQPPNVQLFDSFFISLNTRLFFLMPVSFISMYGIC